MRARSLASSLSVILTMLAAPGPAVSAEAGDSTALVTGLAAQVKQVLRDDSLTSSERQQHFRRVLDEGFDFPMISRFVLGRYWQGSSEPFREEFNRVFEDYVIQSLSTQFASYASDSMKVTAMRTEGERSTIVSTMIAQSDGVPQVKVDWRVEHTAAGYRILDVSVSGISMALAYRDQIAAVIDHGGGQVNTLIPALRNQLERQASNSAFANTRSNKGRP